MQITEYYQDPHVRSRMIEYMGGENTESSTCLYLTRCDQLNGVNGRKLPSQLDYFLHNGLDVCRSLWDKERLIVHLDIEYVNFDFPGEAYLDYRRTFSLQQPVISVTEEILLEYGISPLHLLSGRGHHFVWSILKDSRAFEQLADIGRLSQALETRYGQQQHPSRQSIEKSFGKAFAGLGLVMEYLSGRIAASAYALCDLPIELCAVKVGPQQRGREIISIDISEYGDPLDTRMIRLPFSVYLKHQEKTWMLPDDMKNQAPFMFLIPLHEIDFQEGVEKMRDIGETLKLARVASVKIPDETEATEKAVEDYASSPLALFHKLFYSQEHEDPKNWPQTYDRANFEIFPPCIRHILEYPNDLLLRPEGIRQIVISLLAVGWHPRHIAGLIRSKYERNYGWGNLWYEYDAAERADFYTRIFSGLIFTGQDDLIDFNCLCTKEKQLCFDDHGTCKLEDLRKSVLRRRESDAR